MGDFQKAVRNKQWRLKEISSFTQEILLKIAIICRLACSKILFDYRIQLLL